MKSQVRRVLGGIAAAVMLAAGAASAQAPQQVQYMPRDGAVVVVWMAPEGTVTGYNVYQYEPATLGGDLGPAKKVTAEPIKTTSHAVEGLTNGKCYHFRVTAIVDGKESDQAGPTATHRDEAGGSNVCAVPQKPVAVGGVEGFVGHNIGTNFLGSHEIDANGVITMKAPGWDIWESHDGFYFLATPIEGNVTITARLVSGPTPVDPGGGGWELGGPMIRESLDARSRFALMQIANGRNDTFHQFKRRVEFETTPENTNHTDSIDTIPTEKRPIWARVQRNGAEFSGFLSEDGTNFTQIGETATIEGFSPTAFVGLALTAHNQPDTGILTTAQFDNVKIVKQ